MTTFFTSDTHFHHRNICRYSNRPFSSVHEMNEKMIENWNRVVAPTDNVWHLGDFAFAKADEIHAILLRLNGFKNFIYGNHDHEIMRNQSYLTGRNLWNSIGHYAEFKHNNEFIVLFHYGMRVWNKSHHSSILLYGHSHGSLPPFGRSVDVGVDAPFIIPRYTSAEHLYQTTKQAVSNDVLPDHMIRRPEDYRPVSMEEVLSYMKNRTPEYVDHHNGDR